MKRAAALFFTLLFLFLPHHGNQFSGRPAGSKPMTAALALESVQYAISRVSSTAVSVEVRAKAKQASDMVTGTMSLQQWSGKEWSTIKSKSFLALNEDNAFCAACWTVSSGYFYRLATVFSAALEGQSIVKAADTGAIWVN